MQVIHASERGRIKNEWLDGYSSFSFGPYRHPTRHRFGALRVLNEDYIQPLRGFAMHAHADLEILLLPLSAISLHEDSLGNKVAVKPNELLVMHAGSGICHSQMNGSASEVDHHLQLWFLPRQTGAAPRIEHVRFEPAMRLGRWQLWASGIDGDDAPRIDAAARLYRVTLQAGERADSPARAQIHSAYVQVANGKVKLADGTELVAGDGLAVKRTNKLHFDALATSELVYIEQEPLAEFVG